MLNLHAKYDLKTAVETVKQTYKLKIYFHFRISRNISYYFEISSKVFFTYRGHKISRDASPKYRLFKVSSVKYKILLGNRRYIINILAQEFNI
jgi:hypothetical protein